MKKQLALAVLLAAGSMTANAAEGLSYNYVELDAARMDIEMGSTLSEPGVTATVGDAALDGFALKGSVELGASLYLFGGYQSGEGDVNVDYTVNTVNGVFTGSDHVEFDGTQTQIGLGFHHGVSDRTDLIAEIAAIRTQIDVAGREAADGSDVRGSVGFRGAFSDHFEGWVKGNYTDGDAYDGEASLGLGAHVKFNSTWGLVGEAEFGDMFDQYSLGLRASF